MAPRCGVTRAAAFESVPRKRLRRLLRDLQPAAENDYSTEISIESLDGPDGGERTPGVRTLFTGRSNADATGTLGELRRVESALPRGAYELTVTVRDEESGATASQSRRFQVQGWRAGTTLVPALPRRKATP
jgi:hypothetical protein